MAQGVRLAETSTLKRGSRTCINHLSFSQLVSTTLSGCLVQNDGQRALVGGAAGRLAHSALGYDPVTGAAIGAGAGALCGQAGIGICQ